MTGVRIGSKYRKTAQYRNILRLGDCRLWTNTPAAESAKFAGAVGHGRACQVARHENRLVFLDIAR